MFKCCVCNKSSKKEKNGEVTKQSQKASVVDAKIEENGQIGREEKLNGDVQRFDKVSPSMERAAEVVDDLTVKSPLPSGKRDDSSDRSRLREGSAIESNGKDENIEDSSDRKGENGSDEPNGNQKVSGSVEVNESEEMNKSEKVNGREEVNGNKDTGNGEVDVSDKLSDGGGFMQAILSSRASGTVKTNLYDGPAYIEKTIDDGPDEEGDDSVFEACPNDNANKKAQPGTFLFSRDF